jgi:hypothetical protein
MNGEHLYALYADTSNDVANCDVEGLDTLSAEDQQTWSTMADKLIKKSQLAFSIDVMSQQTGNALFDAGTSDCAKRLREIFNIVND